MSLTSYASRQPATFIKGDVFTEEVRKSSDMLKKANLHNWNIRLRPLESDARTDKTTYEVIRDNPFDGGLDRLGIAGERYGIIQNETIFSLFDELDPLWEAAGAFRNGAVVFAQADSERTIVIDPQGIADVVKPSVVASTTHDGSGALRIGRTAMRLDCFNQFNMMFRGITDKISIRHTINVEQRIKAVRLAWKQNNAWIDALSAEANALYAASATDKEFWAIVDHFMGARPEENVKGAQTKWDNSREAYAEAWNGKPNEKAKGTAWGVFNALIERNQWGRKTQNTANGVENFAMAGMGFDIPTNKFREQAFDAAKSLVKA